MRLFEGNIIRYIPLLFRDINRKCENPAACTTLVNKNITMNLQYISLTRRTAYCMHILRIDDALDGVTIPKRAYMDQIVWW